jgi:hypothetical protein
MMRRIASSPGGNIVAAAQAVINFQRAGATAIRYDVGTVALVEPRCQGSVAVPPTAEVSLSSLNFYQEPRFMCIARNSSRI